MNICFDNERQESKTGPVRVWVLLGGGRGLERLNESKYG
jgi:hypothetical protein